MKEIISVMKQCIKDNNLSPQLNNIEFTDKTIIVYNAGNLIVTKNDTKIRGYIDGKSFAKIIDSYSTPAYTDTSDNLLIKEGKRKATISKYILQGEEEIELPASDKEQSFKVTKNIVETLKLCSYSARGNNLNTSGDGIVIDLTGKFKKLYASNGSTMSIGNVLIKGKGKVFLPLFIVENLIKYFKEDQSTIEYCEEYVKFSNGKYTFISLYDVTEDQVDVNGIVSEIETMCKNIEITDTLKNALREICNLTEEFVDLRFVKGRVDINGYSSNSVIEDSVKLDIDVEESKMRLNKDHLKYASSFDKIDLCKHTGNDIDFIKFKKSNVNFFISPIIKAEEE